MNFSVNFFHREFVTPSGRRIGQKHRPYLIAELGLNHNNDIALTQDSIEAAAKSGADAIKIQSFSTPRFIDQTNPAAHELSAIFSSLQPSLELHELLKNEAERLGIDFFSTPLTIDWVDTLATLDAAFIKIASGDLTNFQLLEKALLKGKPLILSTGAARMEEVARTAAFLRVWEKRDALFLHCVSLYPTAASQVNLQRISRIEQTTGALTGFSDHTMGTTAPALAVARGAVVVEKHFTLNRDLHGPDHFLSATPADFAEIREKMDEAFEMREGQDDSWGEEFAGDEFGKRSLYHTEHGIEAMRPRVSGKPLASEFLRERAREYFK